MADEHPKTSNEALRALSRASAVPCYGDDRIAIVRGRGCRLWDADGKEYIDMLAGIAVACLGHAHPVIREALAAQAGLLAHCSNKFIIEPQVRLAEWLCRRTFAERAFFTTLSRRRTTTPRSARINSISTISLSLVGSTGPDTCATSGSSKHRITCAIASTSRI